MTVKISEFTPKGTVAAPPAKSFAHRQIICAALAKGESTIRGILQSEDVSATLDCVKALGAEVFTDGDTAHITGIKEAKSCELFCRESGSTLRFMIPVCLAYGGEFVFHGFETLLSRPLGVYEKLCREQNVEYRKIKGGLYVKGRLDLRAVTVDGSVSSQFITGLMLASPIRSDTAVINIIPPFYSRPYVDITSSVMNGFGVNVSRPDPLTVAISAENGYKNRDCKVEGDCSNAAFLDALGMLGEVEVTGLNTGTVQGDAVYKTYFQLIKEGFAELDIADCPDLAPVLMALGAAFNGVKLINTERLRIKESDRGAAMAEELSKFGVKTELLQNELTVYKTGIKKPGVTLYGHNDHRIVMACAVLLSLTGGKIEGAEAVRKSYPGFFTDIEKLGAEVKYEADSR